MQTAEQILLLLQSDFIKKKKSGLLSEKGSYTKLYAKCGIFLNTNIKEITFNKIIYFKGHYLVK